MIRRAHLYMVAAAIWGIPGINIAVKGIRSYMLMRSDDLWWLMLITVAVSVFFFIIFRRVVRKYSERIVSLPDSVMMDSACVHDGLGNHSEVYTFSTNGFYSILLFRTGADAYSRSNEILSCNGSTLIC